MRKVSVSLEEEERGIWLSVEEVFEDGNYSKSGKLLPLHAVGAYESLLDYGMAMHRNTPLEKS